MSTPARPRSSVQGLILTRTELARVHSLVHSRLECVTKTLAHAQCITPQAMREIETDVGEWQAIEHALAAAKVEG